MSALAGFRAEVTGHLDRAGLKVYDHLPSVIRPPAAVLLHGDPYLEPGDGFGEVKANLVVLMAAEPTTDNKVATDRLDALLWAAVEALTPFYGPPTVGEPAILQNQDQNLLSARLTVSEFYTLERGT